MRLLLQPSTRGFSFVELLIAAAVVILIFGGLTATFQTMVALIGNSKADAGAVSIANERMEYIRSLSYNAVGTVGGIPEGPIPQNATSTLNGLTYSERIFIQYVDAEDDGVGAEDENGILADYKRVKVEVSWNSKGDTKSVSLISDIVPRGIETTAGGGTLFVNVFDASVQPVSGAEVHVYNDTTTSTIDTTTFTNDSGIAIFAGAPAAANYDITVTKPSYSTDGTYSATPANPNPATPHPAVIESEVSTMNFQIDLLSDLAVQTVGEPTTDSFFDPFDDTSLTSTTTDVVITAGGAELAGGTGAYVDSGFVRSSSSTPDVFDSWEAVSVTAENGTSTTVTTQVYAVDGDDYSLVSDTDLPGNSVGFTDSLIDISGLDTGVYPSLAIAATLETEDTNETPTILEWFISHVISEPAIGSVGFTLTGNKKIGTTADETPVYKYEKTHTTDGAGEIDILNLEWDIYTVALTGSTYDIAEACDTLPLSLTPGVDESLKLILVPSTTHSLRVLVENIAGDPIPGATIALSRSGVDESDTASVCGQGFFGGLTAAGDYQLDVSATGYVAETIENIQVDGDSVATVILNS